MNRTILLATLSLLASLSMFGMAQADESGFCQNEALKAAYERFTYEFPESIISIKNSEAPKVEKNKIYHTIQVVDLDTGLRSVMGVITEMKTCKIIAVN